MYRGGFESRAGGEVGIHRLGRAVFPEDDSVFRSAGGSGRVVLQQIGFHVFGGFGHADEVAGFHRVRRRREAQQPQLRAPVDVEEAGTVQAGPLHPVAGEVAVDAFKSVQIEVARHQLDDIRRMAEGALLAVHEFVADRAGREFAEKLHEILFFHLPGVVQRIAVDVPLQPGGQAAAGELLALAVFVARGAARIGRGDAEHGSSDAESIHLLAQDAAVADVVLRRGVAPPDFRRIHFVGVLPILGEAVVAGQDQAQVFAEQRLMFRLEGGEMERVLVEFCGGVADGEHEIHPVFARLFHLIVDVPEVEARGGILAEAVPAEFGGAQRIDSGAGEQFEGSAGFVILESLADQRDFHAVDSDPVDASFRHRRRQGAGQQFLQGHRRVFIGNALDRGLLLHQGAHQLLLRGELQRAEVPGLREKFFPLRLQLGDAVIRPRPDRPAGGQQEAVEETTVGVGIAAGPRDPEVDPVFAGFQFDRAGIDPAEHRARGGCSECAAFPLHRRRIVPDHLAVHRDHDRGSPAGSGIGDRRPEGVSAVGGDFNFV